MNTWGPKQGSQLYWFLSLPKSNRISALFDLRRARKWGQLIRQSKRECCCDFPQNVVCKTFTRTECRMRHLEAPAVNMFPYWSQSSPPEIHFDRLGLAPESAMVDGLR